VAYPPCSLQTPALLLIFSLSHLALYLSFAVTRIAVSNRISRNVDQGRFVDTLEISTQGTRQPGPIYRLEVLTLSIDQSESCNDVRAAGAHQQGTVTPASMMVVVCRSQKSELSRWSRDAAAQALCKILLDDSCGKGVQAAVFIRPLKK
jgi:hypothetical protein